MGVMYVGDHHRISHGAPMRIMSKGGVGLAMTSVCPSRVKSN